MNVLLCFVGTNMSAIYCFDVILQKAEVDDCFSLFDASLYYVLDQLV